MKLSVIIPAHDEADSIRATLDALADGLERELIDYELLVWTMRAATGRGRSSRRRRS